MWQLSCKDIRSRIEEKEHEFKILVDELVEIVERQQCEIDHLTSASYKDDELLRLKEERDEANLRLDRIVHRKEPNQQNIYREFTITMDEEDEIEKWIEKHEHEKHGVENGEPVYHGAVGGGYAYRFTPTSIGVLGKIECGICHETFVFKELS